MRTEVVIERVFANPQGENTSDRFPGGVLKSRRLINDQGLGKIL